MDTSELYMLIVDDEEPVCDVLRSMISDWGIMAKSLTDLRLVADELRRTCYHLLLLDMHMPEMSGLELLASIRGLCPETKIIGMAGYADKDMVISALRLGAFDFLEKPISADVLYCAVKRALESQHVEHVPQKPFEEFWQNQLARPVKSTQATTEQRIVLRLQALVIPLLEKLREDIHLEQYESQLTMVIRYIQDLTSRATMDHLGNPALTLTELRVASMVKQGLRSGDIATCLGISPDTVKTHRRNIRKKLHIVGTKKHLAPYLASFESNTSTSRSMPEIRQGANGNAL